MNIETVKEIESGYLVNGSLSVPNAPGNRDYQAVQEWIAAGNTPEPAFTQAEIIQKTITDYDNKIEQRLNEEARRRTYNSIESIAKYLGYENTFRIEAESLGAWAANTWDVAHGILNNWQASQATANPQPIPTWEEIELQLPEPPA